MKTRKNAAIFEQGLIIATILIEPFEDIKISGERQDTNEHIDPEEKEENGEDPSKEQQPDEPSPSPEPLPLPDIEIPDRIQRDPVIEPGTNPMR